MRELFDFGDRTAPGPLRDTTLVARVLAFAWVVVTVGGAAEAIVGFRRFFGLSRVFEGLEFSLSEDAKPSLGRLIPLVMTGLELICFCAILEGDGCLG